MKGFTVVLILVLSPAVTLAGPTPEIEASPPRGVILAVYDTGQALVSDLRSVTLARGENWVRFTGLPTRLEAASVSFGTVGGSVKVEATEQYFQNDLGDLASLLARYSGQPAEVSTAGETGKGQLLAAGTGNEEGLPSVVLRSDDGSTRIYPNPGVIEQIRLPGVRLGEASGPSLFCRLSSSREGPVNLRMWYMTRGLSWTLSYEILLEEGGAAAELLTRAALQNQSGGDFENARVNLVATTRGRGWSLYEAATRPSVEEAPVPIRYPYGAEDPLPEPVATASSVLTTLEVPGQIALKSGETRYFQLLRVEKLPIRRFYVYDGVRFDRFQRNRRTDWNYGTEFHRDVELRLAFDNTESVGLGFELPPGILHLYSRRKDKTVDSLSESRLPGVPAGEAADLSLGSARGLSGERERTAYNEVVPLREVEESFEIRLFNGSPDEVEIRVVEHLYRGAQFDIVKSDTEYTKTGPQTIEFRPVLKPGGKRSVHYTARYRW
ncbi:MAG: hypothetical protein KKC51_10140 [Verrucomicrobia bacterium]|nr:hypothetical protein [Verrucomicrobiota bacterium]